MSAHGLEVFDVTYNGVNGGSLRAYIRHHTGNIWSQAVLDALKAEEAFFTEIGDVATAFHSKIDEVRTKIISIINDINEADLTIAVMGASTKGNTILQYFGLTDADIIHAAEINPDKFGKYTVGSNIPIISQQESMRWFVDYYLILPWGFINNFIDRNKQYLMNGGAFLVPLPKPRVITMTKDGELWIHLL
jgi:NDP-4-keto-2,6-dideoxyhexose 3-C-methyltransferase